jgi:hypothetical protein
MLLVEVAILFFSLSIVIRTSTMNRLLSISTGAFSKATRLAEPVVYYAKVSGSFFNQVALHTKLYPLPNVGKGIQG